MAKQAVETFILRNDFYPQVKLLSREQRGDLLTALFAHSAGGDLPDMDAVTAMCFAFIRSFMDDNRERYEARCEKNRTNGARGGRPTEEPNETEKSERLSKKPNETEKSERLSKKPNGTEKTERSLSEPYSSSSSSFNIISLSDSLPLPEDGAGDAVAERERDFVKSEVVDESGKIPVAAECDMATEQQGPAKTPETGQISRNTPQNDQVVDQGDESSQIEEKRLKTRMLEVLCLERGLQKPAEELERFVNHYAKSGWVDANGNPIRNKLAALKAWKPADNATKLPPGVVKLWREAAEAIEGALPSSDYSVMFEHFRGFAVEGGVLLIFAAHKRLVDFLEQKEVQPVFRCVLSRRMPNASTIKYRVPRC